jgi:amidohydrolase
VPPPVDLAKRVEEIAPDVIELRRRLHEVPEPAYQEQETSRLLAEFLADRGVEPRLREPATGMWVDTGPGPRIGFRADIDGLPIVEPADHVPRSSKEGWMHACGHDAHAAIAAGIAVLLGRLDTAEAYRILFQPAEETFPGGASKLVSEGLVDGLKALIAFHVDPGLEVGRIGSRHGPITGSADGFSITLTGPGGHTSRPHRTVDLLMTAARVVSELPAAIRKSIDARTPVVIAFGSIHGGDAANVIPTEVVLRGTVRTLDRSLWDTLPALVEKTVAGLAGLDGADYELKYHHGIPPVVNDSAIVDAASRAMSDALGDDAVVGTETSMGGEDFSNYLEIVPGALFRLGAASGGGDLHSASFRVNEAAIQVGLTAGVSGLLGLAGET